MQDAARRIEVGERRARLALRHRLAPSARVDDPARIAADLVALHGTDPASVYLAVLARMRVPEIAAVERALYEERTLVRMLGMRRTMFVVPTETAALVDAACTRAIAVHERRKVLQLLEHTGIADDPVTWLDAVATETLAALEQRGEATAAELGENVPRLRAKYSFGEGTKWAGTQTLTTRVLFLLAAEGRIVRGRPRGSWTSSQFRWLRADSWVPRGRSWARDEARVELARLWLARFGPGTIADLRWWTGWTLGDVRRALAGIETEEVELDGESGLVLGDDLEPVETLEPWPALLPALDPTVMGWAGRDWYLGGHAPALFDRSGNVGPTVWWDGRIVGGWAQRKDGEVAFRLLEDVGAEAAAAIEAAAADLAGAIGRARVTPRFRTPLERELAA